MAAVGSWQHALCSQWVDLVADRDADPQRWRDLRFEWKQILEQDGLHEIGDLGRDLQPGCLLHDQDGQAAYRVENLVGEGGCGYVVRCTELDQGRELAIKFPNQWRRVPNLMLEGRLTCLEPITYLAKTFLVEMLKGDKVAHHIPALVMEYIPGGNVYQRLRLDAERTACETPFEDRQLANWAAQVASALQALDVVHRDIKPENIMLDGADQAVIGDFGIALPGHIPDRISYGYDLRRLGTPGYMSPEQAEGTHHIDSRSDIFALGLTLAELVSGVHPYRRQPGESSKSFMIRIAGQDPDLSHLDRASPLTDIISACCARHPAARYQSWSELLDELDPIRYGVSLQD